MIKLTKNSKFLYEALKELFSSRNQTIETLNKNFATVKDNYLGDKSIYKVDFLKNNMVEIKFIKDKN